MADVSYSQVMDVTLSWDRLKTTPNYQEVAGELIFLKMFQLEPAAKKMFKFKDGEDIRSNPLFFKHARAMVDMIDCAVGFLGPDLDPLTEDLNALGKRHVSYGVKAAYLPLMGESLYFALSKVLGSKFTSGDQKSWEAVFAFMIDKMVKGMSV